MLPRSRNPRRWLATFFQETRGDTLALHNSTGAEQRTCRFMAMEGATFVLVATQVLTTAQNMEKNKLTDAPFVEAPGGGRPRFSAPMVRHWSSHFRLARKEFPLLTLICQS